MKRWRPAGVVAAALLSLSTPARGQACADDPAYAALDFWVGDWDVRAGGQRVGENRIEKILGGCALLEHWTDAGGGEGKSLFYYVPAVAEWRQVWVTKTPDRPGGVKEKTLLDRLEDGGVRFHGEIAVPDS